MLEEHIYRRFFSLKWNSCFWKENPVSV
jgi:hypothetical protein